MSDLPVLRYSTSGMPPDQAFAVWKNLMAPQYTVEPASQTTSLPGGAITVYLLGDILANRTFFGVQRVMRGKRLIDATPDHVALQLWRTGGYRGEVDRRTMTLGRGQVALADRRRELDCRFTASDTLGFVIPRSLLDGINLDSLTTALDPVRSRLAAAQITFLYRQMPRTTMAEVPVVTSGLGAFMHRLLDPSPARDVLQGPELDPSLFVLAGRAIAVDLASSDLTPDRIADRIGTSRATLYRAFAPAGGVMRYVWDMRLGAVKAALDDPIETRRLTRLASDHGFKTLAHLSRSFRARYGVSPSEWREERADRAREELQETPAPVHVWWDRLGR